MLRLVHLYVIGVHAERVWFSGHATASLRGTGRGRRRIGSATFLGAAGFAAVLLVPAMVIVLLVPMSAGGIAGLVVLGITVSTLLVSGARMIPGVWRSRGTATRDS